MARLAVLALAIALAGCGSEAQTAEGDGPDREPRPSGMTGGDWKTDFDTRSVELDEFADGGPPRDGIPPIDEPQIVSAADADPDIEDREPVMVVELDGRARAYPLAIMIWHEIVNDDLGGTPIAVTYCPLCNSAIVFDRRVDGRELTFGTTGKLRRSDLVMWDRQTESWWQQFTGEALVGELTGTRLTVLASRTLSWEDFRAAHPDGTVLSRNTGIDRPYGRNPYAGYDADPREQPFLLEGDADGRLPAKERVLLVRAEGDDAVVPFSRLRDEPVVTLRASGDPVVVLYDRGVLSVLDEETIVDSRDVGTAAAYDPRVDGRTLTFRRTATGFEDAQTASTWDVDGRAVAGPLRGRRLEAVLHDQQLWFAVAAFLPDVRILRG